VKLYQTARVQSQNTIKVKVKVIPQQAEVAQGVSANLGHRIFLTFGTIRVVSRQPYAPAAFILVLIFRGRVDFTVIHEKKSPVTPSRIDPGTVRLVAQCLNHYATPGPTEHSNP